MKFLRSTLDRIEPHFAKGGKLEKYYPIYEMIDTFIYTPDKVTQGRTHIKDALDLKRMMTKVVLALIPVLFVSFYNVGLQATRAIEAGEAIPSTWQFHFVQFLNLNLASSSLWSNILIGILYFIPIFLVTQLVGGFWEVLFATVRKHEINEGFLVTGALFPLIVPPNIPLWQVALGISFGVVLGKEVFGGTGRNFLNPALTARAFLFFAYPAQISGEKVWTAIDGLTSATPLSVASSGGQVALEQHYHWIDAFLGFIPGSFGETSALACLLGAIFLIWAGIASWRIMVGTVIAATALSFFFYSVGSATNPMFSVSPLWHLVLGGFAFGVVFMATDPVSAAMTQTGQWIYGVLIGILVILVRVVNHAYPEGMMLAILLGNVCAPLIDYYVVRATIRKRIKRHV